MRKQKDNLIYTATIQFEQSKCIDRTFKYKWYTVTDLRSLAFSHGLKPHPYINFISCQCTVIVYIQNYIYLSLLYKYDWTCVKKVHMKTRFSFCGRLSWFKTAIIKLMTKNSNDHIDALIQLRVFQKSHCEKCNLVKFAIIEPIL